MNWKVLTDFGRSTLKGSYLLKDETPEQLVDRVVRANVKDEDRVNRLKQAMFDGWWCPATPVLSNSGTDRGLPISCFVAYTGDNKDSIFSAYGEDMWLGSMGGGIGRDWSAVREIGAKVGAVGESGGIIPFLKISDSITNGVSQGALRRASEAAYLDVSHPEIEEFIDIRRNTGASIHRRCINLHHGVNISDAFMEAVVNQQPWDLISPKTGDVVKTVDAYELFVSILEARIEKGEPYLFFKDTANRASPELYKLDNLTIHSSQLCNEIMLATDENRTAVCCLASFNMETYDEWKDDEQFVEDVFWFLDGVLNQYLEKVNKLPDHVKRMFEKTVLAVLEERSVGAGLMGFHYYLQKHNIPFESALASGKNRQVFSFLREAADKASRNIAEKIGSCQLAERYGRKERFVNKLAVAPTASISIICGESSAGIDPIFRNCYVHENKNGSTTVKNKWLDKVINEHAKTNGESHQWVAGQWKSILAHNGSVQHLEWMDDWTKDVFKTAYEIDNRWIIEHASVRQQYIDQGQSVNLFLQHDVNKKDLLGLHVYAWKKGLKGLYYCRSTSVKKASVGHDVERQVIDEEPKYEECLSCQ